MRFLAEDLEKYVEQYTSVESKVLSDLNRRTHLEIMLPQMLSGHIQGAFLQMLSVMMRPKRILEVGTYTGYSAICLAEGLTDDGCLHTIDINEELESIQEAYFKKSGKSEQIKLHIGNALDIIPALDETFDLVFIDADKVNYINYYNLLIDKVRKNGIILADNVLWSGRVLNEKKDKDTQALHNYNQHIHQDERVSNLLLPIRDGIMMARKLV